jgi:hypothetical protein
MQQATTLPDGIVIPPRSSLKRQDSSTTTTSSRSSLKSQVSFGSVQIRTYFLELGGDGVCSSGAPLTIAWDHHDESDHDVDVYECRSRKKHRRDLWLNHYRRQGILRQIGYSDDDIKKVEDQVTQVRKQRTKTVNLMLIHRLEELARSAGRKIQKFKLRKSRPIAQEMDC